MPTRIDWEAAVPKCPRMGHKGRERIVVGVRCGRPLTWRGTGWACDQHGRVQAHEVKPILIQGEAAA